MKKGFLRNCGSDGTELWRIKKEIKVPFGVNIVLIIGDDRFGSGSEADFVRSTFTGAI